MVILMILSWYFESVLLIVMMTFLLNLAPEPEPEPEPEMAEYQGSDETFTIIVACSV